MTNLTLSVPDDLLQRARERAAREGTSVSSVVRASLSRYVDDDSELGDAWDEFLTLAQRSPGRSPAGHRSWRRADLQRTDAQRDPGAGA